MGADGGVRQGRVRGVRASLWPWPWPWLLAAATAVLLAASIVVYMREGHPTVRPLLASESMPDGVAHEAADATVRAWTREHAAGNYVNLAALSCPDDRTSFLGRELETVKNNGYYRPFKVSMTQGLVRADGMWTINVLSTGGSAVFAMRIHPEGLCVSQIGAAPVP